MNKIFANILALKSGMYTATQEDGAEVIVMREVGCGFEIHEETHDDWFEIRSYDEEGHLESIRYEKGV